MNTDIRLLYFLVILAMSQGLWAAETPEKAFVQAYKSYQAAKKSGDEADTLAYAKQSLDLGLKVYPEDSEVAINLRYNYGAALLGAEKLSEAGHVFESVVDSAKKKWGDDSIKLVDPYLMSGHVRASYRNDDRGYKRFYYNALNIVENAKGEDSEGYAQINYEIGRFLFSKGKDYESGPDYIKPAYAFFKKAANQYPYKLGMSSFYLAKAELYNRDYEEAERYFLNALDIFESEEHQTGELRPIFERMALTIHAFLVDVYESDGRPDMATEHCQIVGRAESWTPNQEPIALYKRVPSYPDVALKMGREGHAILQYRIDEAGFPSGFKVVETSGGPYFGEAAVEAVKKWRFVPQFKDGKPVVTESAKLKVSFVLPE